MVITHDELGRRLRLAREAGGLTQDEVGERIGVARSAIAQIEAGRRAVSSVELSKLAHVFGRDIGEFVATEFEEENPLAALFRADAEATNSPAVSEALRDCLALGREFTNLERILGIDRDAVTAASYPWSLPQSRWDAIQQGQRLAEEERRRLGLGAAPVADLVDLLDGQGIRTRVIELPGDVSGLTLFDRAAGVLVVVNGVHGAARKRFSFAHEYAHALVDRARAGLVSRASDRADLLEVRANAFAAAFVMPEDGVRQVIAALGKGRPSRSRAEVFDVAGSLDVEGRTPPGSQTIQLYDVVQLAHVFGVSRIAVLYRLLNLKLLTQPEFDGLKKLDDEGRGRLLASALRLGQPEAETSAQSGDDEPSGGPDKFHHRFLSLALEAYRRDEISRSKLRELGAMVGLTPRAVDETVRAAGIGDEGASAKSQP